MATKQAKSVTDKKVSIPTKQVPSKKPVAPAKKIVPIKKTESIVKLNAKETKAFHATKSMDDKAAIVAGAALKSKALTPVVKKTIVKEVQQGILAKANTAVAKANLAKAKEREVDAKANLKKVDAEIKAAKSNAKKIGRHIGKAVARAANVVEAKDGPKAAAPLKKIVKKIDAIVGKKPGPLKLEARKVAAAAGYKSNIETAVKKTGADTKGYRETTHEQQAAFAAKREASKGEPAKKPVKAVATPAAKSATPTRSGVAKATTSARASSPAGKSSSDVRQARPKQVNKDTAVNSTSLDEKSIIPSVLSAASAPAASIIPPAAELARQVQQAAKPALPRMMSTESAINREELLRRSFGTLIAGAAR